MKLATAVLTEAEREELHRLQSEFHSASLGDRPHHPGVEKLRRLIELETRVERSQEIVTRNAKETELIAAECDALKSMLLAKRAAYGNSALDPVRIFSKVDPIEQLKVRLDDKISRLMRGEAAGEDVEKDLLGYLVLLRVARKMREG